MATKVPIVKAMAFLAAMYGFKSWTIKEAECQRVILSNCGVREDSWESLEQQGDETSQS